MVSNNTDPMETAFTVSVDLKGKGVTTGISASDRALTIQALVDEKTRPLDLSRPGHIFPIIAKEGGFSQNWTYGSRHRFRAFSRENCGVIVEIMNEDGTMARLPQLMKVAEDLTLRLSGLKIWLHTACSTIV